MLHLLIFLYAYFQLFILSTYGNTVVDKTSFIVQVVSNEKFEAAEASCFKMDYVSCLMYIEESINLYPRYDAIYAGIAVLDKLSIDHISWLQNLLINNGDNLELLLALGIEIHLKGRYKDAVGIYTDMLNIVRSRYGDNDFIRDNINNIQKSYSLPISLSFISDIYFNMAVSYQYQGLVQESSESYSLCLDFQLSHASCRLNLAALHHQHGQVITAINHYEYVLKQLYFADTHSSNNDNMTEINPTMFKSLIMSRSGFDLNSLQDAVTRITRNRQYIMVKSNLGNAYLKYGHGLDSINIMKSLLSELDAAAVYCGCLPPPSSSLYESSSVSSVVTSVSMTVVSLPKYVYFFVPRMTSMNLHDSSYYTSSSSSLTTVPIDVQYRNCDTLIRDELQSLNNLLLANRASCHWQLLEEHSSLLLRYTLLTIINNTLSKNKIYT